MNIFWFRRDLRLHDNAGLYHALKNETNVQCLFIFDTEILDRLENNQDPRVHFIHNQIIRLKKELKSMGSDLWVYYGEPVKIYERLLSEFNINSVYCNRDYEQYAIKRDRQITHLLKSQGKSFHSFKDHIIFEGTEVLKNDGLPYTVFTPYKKKWLARMASRPDGYYFKSYPTLKYQLSFHQSDANLEVISLEEMGFKQSDIEIPDDSVPQSRIKAYGDLRNFPAVNGTSKLGIHFRFGTISIREKARKAEQLSEVYLSELIWRDFYSQILYHFPKVETNAFREKYESIEWRHSESDFESWKEGKTGYPMVDAGMRELKATGYMHNRVRMITSSFLTKHLLLDWRWGEAYFAEKLLDFDLSSNSGGWQWAAGCGTDAAPYFRIFNPESQQKKFDPKFEYIKKWIPEWGTDEYPKPIVDHKFARQRCLDLYKAALSNN